MRVNGYYAALSLIALLLPSHSTTAPTSNRTPVAPLCFRHTNPWRRNERVPVPCGETVVPQLAPSLQKKAVTSGKFKLLFTCIPQQAPSCAKAKYTFQQAFTILESYLILKANIIVNATYLNFCTVKGQCDEPQVLGSASPANSMQLEDSDGVARLYPQALLKQLDLPSRPKFEPIDIACEFNAAANFHFPSDTSPPKSSQSDMLSVVVHELIHGLGFTSSWDLYVNTQGQTLTPALTGTTDGTGQYKFRGFVENIFDRFIVERTTGKPMSARTAALNKIFEDSPPTYQNRQSFYSTVQASQAANSISLAALKLATTPNSLSFRASNGQTMTLESSLRPYATGSSISHADITTFTKTADFIMRFQVDSGVSLAATARARGGPIGPVLLSVLKTLGYTINSNPNLTLFLKSNGSSSRIPNILGLQSLLYALWACLCFIR